MERARTSGRYPRFPASIQTRVAASARSQAHVLEGEEKKCGLFLQVLTPAGRKAGREIAGAGAVPRVKTEKVEG